MIRRKREEFLSGHGTVCKWHTCTSNTSGNAYLQAHSSRAVAVHPFTQDNSTGNARVCNAREVTAFLCGDHQCGQATLSQSHESEISEQRGLKRERGAVSGQLQRCQVREEGVEEVGSVCALRAAEVR